MSIIDTAKELLRKGIALNDEDLINMANSLLEVDIETETPAQPEPKQVVKEGRKYHLRESLPMSSLWKEKA